MQVAKAKVSRNQFKCFHCRLIFSMKDGNWFDWNSMQVHLCRSCEKITEDMPQRARRKT